MVIHCSTLSNDVLPCMIQSPAYCRPAAFDLFARQLSHLEDTTGLFRAAFAISLHERPEAQLSEAETIVENLIDTVRKRVQSVSQQALLAHLHDVLFDVFGLRGNQESYYDPANSYLGDVLQTRMGIPISLVLVYKRIAEPLGLTVHGVNTPGHFLAEVELTGPAGVKSMYVDPFFEGMVLDRHDMARRVVETTGKQLEPGTDVLARATPRIWLGRMLNNLQASFAAAGNERNVCAMEELRGLL